MYARHMDAHHMDARHMDAHHMMLLTWPAATGAATTAAGHAWTTKPYRLPTPTQHTRLKPAHNVKSCGGAL